MDSVDGKGSPTGEHASDEALLTALERLAYGLVAVTSRSIQDETSRGGLTFQQWRALVVLGFADDGLRVKELGRRIAASGSSASRLVDRLAERGLVASVPDPTDGRAIRVGLTDEGRSLRARIVDRRRTMLQDGLESVAGSRDGLDALADLADAFERWV